MELKLKRIARKDTYTIGKLYVNGEYFCDTLEDKDRGLNSSMSIKEISKIKVYGKTAIPTGTYTIIWSYSNKFKKPMPLLLNVPGYSGVRIHSGNTAQDTLGCILCGKNTIVGKVTNSRVYTNKLYSIVKSACNKEKVTLTIE